MLRDAFFQSVRGVNLTDDGSPWLTDSQLEQLYEEITLFPGKSLIEANEAAQKLLARTVVDVNEVTGEEFPEVHLIDFKHPERNHFLAINQFQNCQRAHRVERWPGADVEGDAGNDYQSTTLDVMDFV